MSRKTTVKRLLASGESLGASFNSDPVGGDLLDNIGIWLETAGVTDNTGTFAVQVRWFSEDGLTFGPWTALTLSSVPTLADADANFFINLNQIPPAQFRVAFTAAGSTPDGTCNIYFSACQV